MLTSLKRDLFPVFALRAFHPQDNFLRGFCLLSEYRFGLAAETLLFTVVTPSTLRRVSFLALFVLCNFMRLVHLALLAESAPLFRYVNHLGCFERKGNVI